MPDIIDRAQDAEAAFRDDALARRELRALHESAAPTRSRSCRDCGAEIPAERLAAVPTAARCWECQHRHERYKGA